MDETKEEKIRKITQLYYSRKDVQKAIWGFCQFRETIPKYFEGFGKRPDSLEYPSDVIQQVKKGATSFHCSEELWDSPLELSTGLTDEELNNLRKGWDLLIDIDCKWFDYSKKAAEAVIKALEYHNVKNIGIKFSGSKGFHIIIPWKAFPQQIGTTNIKDMFPELPRKVASYLRSCSEKILRDSLPKEFYSHFKDVDIRKGIKCKTCGEIADTHTFSIFVCPKCKREEQKKYQKIQKTKKCPDCNSEYNIRDSRKIYECKNCEINSEKNPDNFSQTIEVDLFELMGLDIVLVSKRHLFRVPYSLHEKTRLASVVLTKDEIENFQPKDADPLKIKIRNFMPDSESGEASELLLQAMDWKKEESEPKEKGPKKFKEINIDKRKLILPPSIEKILKGIKDGRKRALFILINFFRSLNFEKEEIEEKIKEWNNKNEKPLKQGYITSQFTWTFKQKKLLPPNYDKLHYKGIGIIPTEEELKYKNPVSYAIRKTISQNKKRGK